jgi:hypothetical protein
MAADFWAPVVMDVTGNIPGKTQTIPTAIFVAIHSGNMMGASIIEMSFIKLVLVQIIKSFYISRHPFFAGCLFYCKKTEIRKKHQLTVQKEGKKELPILAAE